MVFTQEPNLSDSKLKPEMAFQHALKAEIIAILDKKKAEGKLIEYSILEGFGLDLAVFLKWFNCYSSKFFELKAFVGHRQGGVGFGNGKGEGVQVDLLLMDTDKLLFLNQFARWILIDGTKEYGTRRYAIFDNVIAKNAAMGTMQKGKQNNFRVSQLISDAISWTELSKELEIFLLP